MIVADASAVVDLILGRPCAAHVRRRIEAPGETVHAPHLLDVEVGHALRRLHRQREIDEARARAGFAILADLRVRRHRHTELVARAWQLRENLTMYDGVYVALAEVLDAPLLTLDGRLASTPGHSAVVEVAQPE